MIELYFQSRTLKSYSKDIRGYLLLIQWGIPLIEREIILRSTDLGKILNLFTKDVEFKIHIGILVWKYLMIEIKVRVNSYIFYL